MFTGLASSGSSCAARSLVVRVDAGPDIGSGHFMRCLALAQAWKEQAGNAVFISTADASVLEERLFENDIRTTRLTAQPGSAADVAETAELARRHEADWVALDGYQFSPNYQRALRDKISRLLMFDDLGDAESYHADLLVNQNAYATPEMYANRAVDCSLLLGSAHLLLRREFRGWQHRERLIPQRARNVLVTFGGSDPENATALALQALTLIHDQRMNVRVLVGASNPNRDRMERLAAQIPHNVEFQTDSTRMAHEMAWADMAISAAGSTSWELAFMGVPSLLITVAKNQHGCAQYLQSHGIAISLGWQHQLGPAETAAALSALSADVARRSEMSSLGRALIDGLGCDRIVQAMAGVANPSGQSGK